MLFLVMVGVMMFSMLKFCLMVFGFSVIVRNGLV